MSAFTDDDLKRMKKELHDGLMFNSDRFDLEALLSRLEAAEDVIQSHRLNGKIDVLDYAYAKWRKKTGK